MAGGLRRLPKRTIMPPNAPAAAALTKPVHVRTPTNPSPTLLSNSVKFAHGYYSRHCLTALNISCHFSFSILSSFLPRQQKCHPPNPKGRFHLVHFQPFHYNKRREK